MSDDVVVPRWQNEPITPGWWWLQFSDGPGPRYWDGVFWNRGSYFAGAEDYAEFPILGPCLLPDVSERYIQALKTISELPSNYVSAAVRRIAKNAAPDTKP